MHALFKTLFITLLLSAHGAFGCAVCGGPLSPRTMNTYLVMTLVLSLAPLLLLGAGLWIFLKRPNSHSQGKEIESSSKGITGL
jgi:hypothetical protein